jgi:hypothetical protein
MPSTDADDIDGHIICSVSCIADGASGVHADLAGRFPHTSWTGNNYMRLVCTALRI